MPSVSEAKERYAVNMNRLLDTYGKVMFCTIDNVRSQQLHQIRRDLRGKAELLMGKKTMQKKIIALRAEGDNSTDVDKAMRDKFVTEELLCGNVGLLFTNGDVTEMKAVFDKHRVQAPARVGSVAPVDVIVPSGNTGMEPTATSFFQALNIATKITKGAVEIIAEKKVVCAGEKVDNSTATLLQKLKINPFYYAVDIVCMWDRGMLFTKEDLSLTDETIEQSLMDGIQNLTALSLGADIPTEVAFPYLVKDAFRNLLAVSVATDYEFDEFDGKNLRKAILEGTHAAPAAAAAGASAEAAPAAAAAPAAEEEEEDEDFGMGGLF